MFAVGSGKATPFKFVSSISQDLFNSGLSKSLQPLGKHMVVDISKVWEEIIVLAHPFAGGSGARSWITKSSLPRLCIALPKLAALEVFRLATYSLGVVLSKVSQKKCSRKVVGQTNVTDVWLDKWGFKAMYLHVDCLSFSICIFFMTRAAKS